MDEDIVLLHDDWFERLEEDLLDDPKLAIVGCAEIKEPTDDWPIPSLRRVPWIAAYLIAVDRKKLPWASYDENMPGLLGMTDVDLCLQARNAGYDVGCDTGVVVLHQKLPELKDPEIHDHRSTFRQNEMKLQFAYMYEKWGEERFKKFWTTGVFNE
jgi:hypothetical protein